MSKGANINTIDKMGANALIVACGKKENLEIVKFLVESGIDTTVKMQGFTARDMASGKEIKKYLKSVGVK